VAPILSAVQSGNGPFHLLNKENGKQEQERARYQKAVGLPDV